MLNDLVEKSDENTRADTIQLLRKIAPNLEMRQFRGSHRCRTQGRAKRKQPEQTSGGAVHIEVGQGRHLVQRQGFPGVQGERSPLVAKDPAGST